MSSGNTGWPLDYKADDLPTPPLDFARTRSSSRACRSYPSFHLARTFNRADLTDYLVAVVPDVVPFSLNLAQSIPVPRGLPGDSRGGVLPPALGGLPARTLGYPIDSMARQELTHSQCAAFAGISRNAAHLRHHDAPSGQL